MLPLEGINVLDFTQAAGGPFCGMLLGDMGAEVTKIEPPSGDHFRAIMGGYWVIPINRNKRGLAIDLKNEKSREIIFKLIERADVLIEAFVPGVMDKLGLGYATVKEINPRLIYCSVSGYGQDGPYRTRAGYDVCAQAESGLMAATGEPGRPPVRIASSLVDYGTGFYGAYGIMLALWQREKIGRGQQIDVSLFDTAVSLMNYWISIYSMTGENPPRLGSGHKMAVPYQVFETQDVPVFIGVSNDKAYKKFCVAFNRTDLSEDARFSSVDLRCENREILVFQVQEMLKKLDSKEVIAKMVAAGIPCAPVLRVSEMLEDPHVNARGMIVEMEVPGTGPIKMPNIAVRLSETPGAIRKPAPRIGEHTMEILKEIGYDDHYIGHLLEQQIVKQYHD